MKRQTQSNGRTIFMESLFVNRQPLADMKAACNAIGELEDSAHLAMLTRGINPCGLTGDQVERLVRAFEAEWDA